MEWHDPMHEKRVENMRRVLPAARGSAATVLCGVLLTWRLALSCLADDAPLVVGTPDAAVWTWQSPGPTVECFGVTIDGFRADPTPSGYVLSIPGQAQGSGPGDPALPSVAAVRPDLPGIV